MNFIREVKDLCKHHQVDVNFMEELETLIRSRIVHVSHQKVICDQEMRAMHLAAGDLQKIIEDEAKREMMEEIWKFALSTQETTELGLITRYRIPVLTEDLGKARH